VEPLEHVIEPVSDPARRVAAGGWRRAALGLALGVVAGSLVASVTPRDGRRADGGRGGDTRTLRRGAPAGPGRRAPRHRGG
jgi:hypothetical protein